MKILKILEWVGGGTILTLLFGGLIYVSSQFSNTNTNIDILFNKLIPDLEKRIVEKTESIPDVEEKVNSIGQKVNDEVIPALNQIMGDNQRHIERLKFLSKMLDKQENIDAKVIELTKRLENLNNQTNNLDSLRKATNLALSQIKGLNVKMEYIFQYNKVREITLGEPTGSMGIIRDRPKLSDISS